MKHFSSFFLFMLLFIATSFAQKNIILEIDKRKITSEEFERIYQKNNSQLNQPSDAKTPSEYMEMFIDFKLKVIEAENLGMDTVSAFKDELAGYRAELAKPYLTDVSYTDKMIHDAYFRTIHEVKASHILIRLEEDALPADTLAAYNKTMEIRQKFLDKEKTFNELAIEFSEDPSAASNGGDLGYFRAFQMVSPFEDAAFNTEPGNISMPFRTKFGYHLVFAQDLRKAKGDIKVAHIMKIFSNPREVSPIEEKMLKEQIDSVYQLLQNGADFGELAQKYSDDKRSAVNNGEMNWINSSFGVPEFTDAAYALSSNGEVSKVIRTTYGWHIIKRLELKELPSYEEMEEDLTSRVKSDPSRSEYSKIAFLNKLKAEHGYVKNTENLNTFIEKVSASTTDSIPVELTPELANLTFFTFAGKKYTSNEYAKYVEKLRMLNGNIPAFEMARNTDRFEDETITAFEDSKLESKYPDFKYLMQEYHDGILLFSIMEDRVWNKAMNDTIGLETYYKKNPNKFVLGEHFDGLLITCNNQDVRDKVDAILANGEKDPQMIEQAINTEESQLVQLVKDRWEKGDSKVIDYFIWNHEKPAELDETLTFVYGDKKNSGIKTLDEARGLYISDYQDYLEKEWVKELRKKYPEKINQKLLKKVKSSVK